MSARFLLDSCAFVWSAIEATKLTSAARHVLESVENDISISATSVWEVATKTRLGKWPEANPVAADIQKIIRGLGYRELSITVDHAERSGSLPGPHKDPFDRILIAQAQAENLTVISIDEIFDEYHIRRIW